MTDLTTVADGAPAQTTDEVMLLRGTTVVTVTIAELLAQTFQAALSLNAGTVLGRSSLTAGGPQPLAFGPGVTEAAGAILANGTDHLGLTLLTDFDVQAELIVNSAERPSRLPVPLLLEWLYSIPPSLTDALDDENGLPLLDQNSLPITG